MQWSATVSIVILVACAGSVKGILVFSFCAIVAFIFVRNLLDGKSKLDFTPYFASKGLGLIKEREALSITTRSFPRGLKSCRHALIRNILRDFVISWYENVAIGGDFILETRSLLEKATVNFYDKLSRTTVNSHTEKLCILLNRHLSATQTAKILMKKTHKNFIETYCSSQGHSRSYQTDELQYLQNVIDLLLYKLVPPKTLGCNAGRFILREILAFKLLLPLLDTISDPDFVNTSIINILKENTDKNSLTTSSEVNEGSKINSNTATSFVEYLDQNLEMNNSNGSSKLAEPETKYKFKNATVLQKDHSEIVELSLEASMTENNGSSDLVEPDDNIVNPTTPALTETTEKTSSSAVFKKPKPAAKEASHSSVINGFAKLKNDLFKTSKEQGHGLKNNSTLGVIHPGGKMFGRQLRKIQSSPVMKQSAGVKLGESAPSGGNLSGNDGCLELLSTSGKNIASNIQDNLASSDENSLEFRTGRTIHESQSLPNFIPGNVEHDPVLSSFEEIDVCDSVPETDVACFPDNGSSTNDSKIVEETKYEMLFTNEKPKLRARRHTTSFSSTGEWDSEIFDQEGLAFDVDGDFSEAGEAPCTSSQSDNVSQADFANHQVPSPCSMISIPSTELMTDYSFETYKNRYTVYVIEYKTQLWTHSNDDDHVEEIEKSEADTQGSIKRRYREFMELHHRLHCGSFAPLMKDIPKPNRKFNSPFFRLDQDVVEGRQSLLQNYLKCLVAKPAILNCEDFKGFLGIGSESQTDFRRHLVPTLPNVPRIDKKLQKKVTKLIDHIKTLVDTAPVEGDKEEDDEDIRKVLGEDKTSPDGIRTFVSSSEGCGKLSNSCCNSENIFRAFIQKHHEDLDEIDHLKMPVATSYNARKTCPKNDHANSTGKSARVSTDDQDQKETNPLTRTVLNLSCHLLEKHESWVCLEPVQEAATAVFGCFIEWWMEGLLSELVREEQWQYYLTLLKDTVWPGGELMKSSEQQKTEEEKLKTKEEAIQTLSNFFGVVLHTVVGEDAMESSAREIVESLQYAEINRQLLLDVLEVVLIEMFPDFMDDKDSYLSSRSC